MKEEKSVTSSDLFSDISKDIISYSREEAIRLGNDFIGTEHFALATLIENNNIGATIIKTSIVKLKKLKIEIESSVRNIKTKDNSDKFESLPLTKQAEQLIRGSVLEAKNHNAGIVDSGCLLLALLGINDSIACQIFEKYGLNYQKASSLYSQIQAKSSEKESNETTTQDTVQKNTQNSVEGSQVRQLIERIINISMKDSIDGVLDIENESSEIASLLIGLSLDQGMMFGLFGQWGRGKTFFWKNIWKNLSKNVNNPFYKVEFHAWKYQDTPATWAYLYEVLVKDFYKKPKTILSINWIGYYFRIFWLNLNRKGTIPILKFLLVIGTGALIYLTIKEIGKEGNATVNFIANYVGLPASLILTAYNLLFYLKKEYNTSAKDIFIKYSEKHSLKHHLGIQAEIQKELSILFKTWIPNKKVGKKRVLIFIDDIDRCNETKIIQIIDSLRIMLDEHEIAKRCVILAAIDERILKIAISTKYYELITKDFNGDVEKKISLENLVREYMDKLFIGGIKLKTLHQIERKEILRSLTKGKIHASMKESELANTPINNVSINIQDIPPIAHIDVKLNKEKLKPEPNDELFELEDFEYQYLQDVLEACGSITPRVIRIFYYRYLLAKRFFFLKTSQDYDLYEKWNNPVTDKSILPYLIMFFTVNVSPKEITNSFFHWSNNSSKNGHLNEFQFVLLNKTFKIEEGLLSQMLQIIEIIVPY